MDGSAAVFGVLSAAFAVLVAGLAGVFAIKGIRDYHTLRDQLAKEIGARLTEQISKELVLDATVRFKGQVDTQMAEHLRTSLLTAEAALREEASRYAKDLASSEPFYEEVSRRVAEKIKPASEGTSEGEFA